MQIENRIKQSRMLNAMAILFGVMGILLFLIRDNFSYYESGLNPEAFIITTLPIILSVSIFLLNYLRTGKLFGERKSENEEAMREELIILRNELKYSSDLSRYNESLYEEVQLIKDMVLKRDQGSEFLSDEEKEKIISSIKKDILNNASEGVLLAIEEKYSKEIRKDKYIYDIRKQCLQVRDRLLKEIESLGRRGNLNLVIGVITTIVAVIVLATTVLSGNHQLSTNELIAYYSPRLTLSIFIEIFSFFFLKLYKAGLSEIKYFQNELTNAELKFIAVEKAIMTNKESSIAEVITELATTERNFKLGKGESTVDLEKYRSDQASNQKIMESLAGLINNSKK
ncbi:hypothetical protein [Aeromonas veronii]|uniref:Uncharacterized protein n=1 Tax=Aeromonas veronii AMC34 TaxID=1073383 RepID=K1ITJ4_AERVE|nr:hypothetical protein [Aeromonas veronii]EKB17463.1 hypothetical protein HMPREF1168_03690 [Aeromonas veronii AMC34]